MKLTFGMEGEKTVPVVVQDEKNVKSRKTRPIVWFVVGVTSLVLVATVVAVSVYLGTKITKDNYMEARQIFRTSDGKVVEEETKVTKKEVEIRVPNQVETIYDFKQGLVVERYVDSETKERSACYVRYMNETESPSNDASDYTNGEVDLDQTANKDGSEEEEKWKSTSRKLSEHMVSEKVAKMCKGTDIFWMEKVQSDEETKRAVCVKLGYTYRCLKLQPRCLYNCVFRYYCRRAGVVYLYRVRTAQYCLTGCRGYNMYCP